MSQPSLKDLQEKLRSLGATEKAETAEPVAIEPQSRTFKKVMFGAGIDEEIETKPFIQPENPPFTDPERFTIGSTAGISKRCHTRVGHDLQRSRLTKNAPITKRL